MLRKKRFHFMAEAVSSTTIIQLYFPPSFSVEVACSSSLLLTTIQMSPSYAETFPSRTRPFLKAGHLRIQGMRTARRIMAAPIALMT